MNLEDVTGAGKLADSTEKLTREIRGLVSNFLDPIAKESGEFVADKIRGLRMKNAVRVMKDALSMTREAGIATNPVPLRILVPVLEGAGLDDEGELLDRWAALLASVAAGDPILTSYPRILAELTPIEAKILDYVVDAEERAFVDPDARKDMDTGYWGVLRPEFETELEIEDGRFPVLAVNMIRLGLCFAAPGDGTAEIGGTRNAPILYQHTEGLRPSPLGRDFVSACRGPSRRA